MNEWISWLKRPLLYERTEERFWDDPHISKGMLKAHLDPNTDAASRRPEFVSRSVAWIAGKIAPGSRILDLGCGPGLYTKQFADRGFETVGIDISERSLTYARKMDSKTEYILDSYLNMEFENAFDWITLIWCDYGALTASERTELMKRAHRALKPGGRLLLDVFTDAWQQKQRESTTWEYCEKGGFWSPHPHLCVNASWLYEPYIVLDQTVIVEEQAVKRYEIWNTCMTPDMLAAEAEAAGFHPIELYENVAGDPYTQGAETICMIVQA